MQAALKSLGLGNVNYAFIEEGSQAEKGKGGGNRAEENPASSESQHQHYLLCQLCRAGFFFTRSLQKNIA